MAVSLWQLSAALSTLVELTGPAAAQLLVVSASIEWDSVRATDEPVAVVAVRVRADGVGAAASFAAATSLREGTSRVSADGQTRRRRWCGWAPEVSEFVGRPVQVTVEAAERGVRGAVA